MLHSRRAIRYSFHKMDHKSAGLILVLIFGLNGYASSAQINIVGRKDFGSFPKEFIFLETADKAATFPRSKRQIVPDAAAGVAVNPPIIAVPLPEIQPTTRASITASVKPATTAAPMSDIAGPASNAIVAGMDTIGQLSALGNQVGQRLSARLDRLQSGVDTLFSNQADAVTDLFKSGFTTGLRVLVAKLRFPLNVLG